MTRYEPRTAYIGTGDYTAECAPDPSGDYVRYDEAAAVIAEKDAALRERDAEIAKVRGIANEALAALAEARDTMARALRAHCVFANCPKPLDQPAK